MIVVVATVRVRPDKIEAFEAASRDLIALIRANEPGTIFYTIAKSLDEANTYRVLECYQNRAAQELHMTATYLEDAGTAIMACLESPPTFINHDGLA